MFSSLIAFRPLCSFLVGIPKLMMGNLNVPQGLRVTGWLFIFLISTSIPIWSQLVLENGTLYGNEWIDYQKDYFKIKIAEDGIYRIPYQTLETAGIPMNNITGDQFQLFRMGKEQPVWVSTSGHLGHSDYIEFYGSKNRSELDVFLFEDPAKEMLNLEHSFFSDTSVYFLTWTMSGPTFRYRDVDNDLSGDLNDPEVWYWHEEKLTFNQSYFKPAQSGVRYSHFVEAEGFGSGLTRTHTNNILVTQSHESGPDPFVTYRLTGNPGSHNIQIQWNGIDIQNLQFHNSIVVQNDVTVPMGDVRPRNNFRLSGSDNSDRIKLSSIVFTYPRKFNFENQAEARFKLNGGGERYIELNAFKHDNLEPILYDITQNLRMIGNLTGDVVRFNLPESETQRDLYIVHPESGIITVETIEGVSFEDLSQSDAEFIIITHAELFSDDEGIDQVAPYAEYRRSSEGGNFNVKVLNINQLIDQFAYGISGNPFSIKNFTNYIIQNWSQPKYLFLIGKSFLFNINRDNRYNSQLPAYGSPGSDNLLVSSRFSSIPLLPVGRLSARNGNDVKNYLDKVRTTEHQLMHAPQTIEDRLWMKKILHLSAGTGTSEQNLIYRKMMGMAEIIEQNRFGGIVTGVRNQSQDIIDESVSEKTLKLINSGVMIKTYFGHGGVSDTQFSGFEDPVFLNNKGRYPVMLSLGCYTGNIYIDQVSLSESNIVSPDKGAICYLATSALGYISALDVFGQEWYRLLGGDDMGLSLGEQFQKVIAKFDDNQGIAVKTLMQQIVFHGDPAIKLIPKTASDLIIDPSSFHFEPEIITNLTNSASIAFDLVNIGVNNQDTVSIHVHQQLSNGQKLVVGEASVYMNKSIIQVHMDLDLQTKESSGLSKLTIVIDEENNIEEQAPGGEQNNTFDRDFVIYNTNLFLVYPPPFGMVSNQDFALRVQTSNPFVEARQYYFEIDTAATFDSPLKNSYTTSSAGGIIDWDFSPGPESGTVYYWRVRFEGQGSEFPWQTSSFIYLPGSTGWNQSHYFQFLSNQAQDIHIDDKRKWNFSDQFLDITIKNHKYIDDIPFIQIGNRSYIYWAWDGPVRGGFNVNIIDGNTLRPWINNGGEYNSSLPNFLEDWPTFPYNTRTEESRSQLIQFLEEIVPAGHYVVVWSIQREDTNSDYQPADWSDDSTGLEGKTLFTVLEDQGAQFIRQTIETGAVPYIFVFKKDDNTFQPIELIANSPEEIINVQFTLSSPGQTGSIVTNRIGPASSWKNVDWTIIEQSQSLHKQLDIFGINNLGDTSLLITENESHSIDVSDIPATEYPNLFMQYTSTDSVTRRPGDLLSWRVHFTGMADLSLNPSRHLVFQSDTLLTGDELNLELAVENIGFILSDTSEFHITILDSKNSRWDTSFILKMLEPGDYQIVSVSYPVMIGGNHQIILNIQTPASNDANLFNNTGSLTFHVLEDLWNPILDVVFDKVHILDGDIVSARPNILISLTDDRVLSRPVSDSTLFDVFIQYESEDLQKISFETGELELLQNTDEKKVELLYTPVYQTDGMYTLTVNARDLSGNAAGQNRFQVRFRVITQQMISNIFNYPNPFSSSTRFVYTLTGSETPDAFMIRILTPSGKVVREITESEIGELRIGTHMTDYAWDGRDEYGDVLASGVYLYQVVVKDNSGDELQKFDTGTDSYFRKDFGKLVIIR